MTVSQFKSNQSGPVLDSTSLAQSISAKPQDLIVKGSEIGMAESLALQMNGWIRAMETVKKHNGKYKLKFEWR